MKQIIAVLFGGCSPEYSVSLQSAHAVLTHIDRERFVPQPVGITPEGDWYLYTGPLEAIADGSWLTSPDRLPAVLSPNRSDHGFLLLGEKNVQRMPVDAVFPVLHGRNGEDGTVQGLAELAGIPVVGCGVLSSALCMDKDKAHRLAAAAGVAVPASVLLRRGMDALSAAEKLGYPLFVKPLRTGSSFGITRVERPEQLPEAVDLAFSYDSLVTLEEAIGGFEVGCAVLGNDTLTVGMLDEIELSGGFFDFTEKYTLKTSAIHVPARVSDELIRRIQDTAQVIYRALGCRGFARVDMFLEPEGRIVFNEVNTIPGFTSHSRYPSMMQAIGLSFGDLVNRAIDLALEQ